MPNTKKNQIKKIEAAQRQVDAAIRMLFAGEDPIAIFTIAHAAERILTDIAEKRGNIDIHERQKDLIQPGYEKEFWRYMNAPANFLKHADKDPDGVYEGFREEICDVTLTVNCLYYKSLTNDATCEMKAFSIWFMLLYPNVIKENILLRSDAVALKEFVVQWSRKDKLEYGRQLLINYRKEAVNQSLT